MNDTEYRQLAELEDRLWHFEALHDHVRRALTSHSLPPNASILDAGCGTGGLLRRMGNWWPEAKREGLDFSPLAVEFARKRVGGTITEGSITALPFAGNSFDAIVSMDVLCQVEQPQAALREFARCLRPGGLVVVNVPAYRWLWSYHDDAVQSHHRFTRPEINTLFRDAGLQPVYATYWNTLLFPAIVLRRKLLPAPRDGTSDVREYSPFISAVLRALLATERLWLKTGLTLPFGTSVFAVAKRP
jgi:ubiquinone/menaquinone biosynthesis C-methylase UbiE